jgi:hypothetical protein
VGMLKRMKDMRDMVSATPEIMAEGLQLAAQAQQMAAAQQAVAQAQMAQYQAQSGFGPGGSAAAGGPDFEPIAGVTLEQFATVSKGVAAYGYDGSKLVEVAQSQGIDAATWQSASQGWNARIMATPAVAQRFNQLYRGA